MPSSRYGPEENCRLLSIYFRPWTLDPSTATTDNPLLSELRNSPPLTSEDFSNRHEPVGKRRRLKEKSADTSRPSCGSSNPVQSYRLSWNHYTNGRVVSELSRRYIVNVIMASAARVMTEEDETHTDSDDDDNSGPIEYTANLQLIQKTLQGIAAHNEDEGALGIGRHASTILLGRNLWETAPLADTIEKTVKETQFKNVFPSAEEAIEQAGEFMKQDNERLMPFVGTTYPSAGGKRVDYKQRLETWLQQLILEKEKPNTQQLHILRAVKDRLLIEIQLEIEGPELRRRLQPYKFSIDRRADASINSRPSRHREEPRY